MNYEYPPIVRFDHGVIYYCGECGYPHIGGAPKYCPRCDAKHTAFTRKTQKEDE